MNLPWRISPQGLEIAVRLTPKGGRERIGGVGADPSGRPVLLVRVSAPPVDGAANKALVKLLAKSLGIAKSSITFMSGETARIKRLSIIGDGPELAKRLRGLAVPDAGK